jgi:hypothetical protein
LTGTSPEEQRLAVDAEVAKVPPLRIEIVKRSDDMRGFVGLPRRWVVERTFSWLGRNRRLAKDFENLAETLGRLRDPRLHPACSQAARQGVDRELNKPPVWQCTMTKVGKWDGKGTFAEACGNDEVAPQAAIHRSSWDRLVDPIRQSIKGRLKSTVV